MDAAVEAVLARYHAREAAEAAGTATLRDEGFTDARDRFLLSVGPETGRFLNILAREMPARTILEIGTSYGYSTVWLAEAARAVGGRVISLDVAAAKQAHAREALREAGLAEAVEFVTGDALQTIGTIAGPFDLVLLDCWKDLYVPAFERFYPKLADGAVVVADNMVRPDPVEAGRYRAHIRTRPDLTSVLLPIGSGLEVSRYRGG